MTNIISIDSSQQIPFSDIRVNDKVARVKADAITVLDVKAAYADRVVTAQRTVFDDTYAGAKFYLLERPDTPLERLRTGEYYRERPFGFSSLEKELARLGLEVVDKS